MRRAVVFTYGVVCYAVFFVTYLYAIGFVGNILVAKSMDSAPVGPFVESILVNVLLLGVFAFQHSIMARPGFKAWWTRFVPQPVERSTYVLLSSLALILLFSQWRPLGGVIWDLKDPVGRGLVYSLFGFGWLLVLVSTFLINHFDLFGLRQVYFYLRGREYKALRFVTPGPYKYVRHPLYVGWLFAFWSTPTMTLTHLLFAVATTAYILVAVQLEERDLMQIHGEAYGEYRRNVPMFIPTPRKRNDLQHEKLAAR